MSDTTDILTGADLAIAAAKATGWTVTLGSHGTTGPCWWCRAPNGQKVTWCAAKDGDNPDGGREWLMLLRWPSGPPRPDRDPAARDALLTEAARRSWIFNMTVNPPGDDDPAGAAYAVFWVKTPGGKHVPIEVTVPGTDTAAFCTAVTNAFVRAAAAADAGKAGTE